MTNSCNSFSGNVDEEPEMKMNNTWTLFVACFGFCEGDKMLWRTHPTIQVGGKRAKDGRWRESRERYWHLTNGLAWRHFQQTNILSYICNFLHHSPSISFHPWPSYVYCKTKSNRFKMQAAKKILGTIQKPLHSSFRQRYFSALTGVQRENALKNLFKPGLFSWKQVRCMPEFYAGCNIRVVLSFLQKNFTKYSHHLPLI